jgi:hypothetical protein
MYTWQLELFSRTACVSSTYSGSKWSSPTSLRIVVLMFEFESTAAEMFEEGAAPALEADETTETPS